MPRFRALELAIDQATRQRDAAALRHAQAIRAQDHGRAQSEQLKAYASDTDARWMGGTGIAFGADLMRHHYQFMERLRQAIVLQDSALVNLERQRASAHQALLQTEFRLAGLRRVLDERRAQRRVLMQRREQRVADDYAATRHAHRLATESTGECA